MRVWIAALTLAAACLVGEARAEKRVALVIGNSDYQKPDVRDLPNAANDARAVSRMLTDLGFTVTTKIDLGYEAMRIALRDFSAQADGADAAIVHFAGHGIELSFGGGNFFMPVDAELKTPQSARQEMFPLSAFEEAVSAARGLKLIILDACRDNPFPTTITRGADRGLARPEPRERILIAFSARHGTKAQDGPKGGLSPFAAALIENMPLPGEEIRFVMGRVEDAVMKATDGAQQPFTYGSLGGSKVFLVPEASAPRADAPTGSPSVIAPAVSEAERAWALVDLKSKEQLLAYRKRFPNTFYADVAASKLLELERVEVAARAPAAQPAAPEYHYVWDTRPPDDYLSLRSQPTTRAGYRIMKMPNGTLLEVLEKRPDDWWYVRAVAAGQEGWTKFRDDRDRSRVWISCCRSR
ncbi:MAG: caspase family protein [Hyphomicrobiales bacterium]|nr:caspase family protein [Hyphomicrobiales bacterium]